MACDGDSSGTPVIRDELGMDLLETCREGALDRGNGRGSKILHLQNMLDRLSSSVQSRRTFSSFEKQTAARSEFATFGCELARTK